MVNFSGLVKAMHRVITLRGAHSKADTSFELAGTMFGAGSVRYAIVSHLALYDCEAYKHIIGWHRDRYRSVEIFPYA